METRNISVALEKAKEWYKSGNSSLKEIALQAFTKRELESVNFKEITTFEKAVDALISVGEIKEDKLYVDAINNHIENISSSSAAMFRLNIVRRALNFGHTMDLLKGEIWYPHTPFASKKSTYYKQRLKKGELQKVAEIAYKEDLYDLFGGLAFSEDTTGLGGYDTLTNVGYGYASVGFLGCATKEIAEHMGLHFAKDIFKAKYASLLGFAI